jgi:hypothetical protein
VQVDDPVDYPVGDSAGLVLLLMAQQVLVSLEMVSLEMVLQGLVLLLARSLDLLSVAIAQASDVAAGRQHLGLDWLPPVAGR